MSKMQRLKREEIPLAPKEENTFGLRVFRDTLAGNRGTEIHWQYDLPDGVVVLPVTLDRRVVAIKKERPGVGSYPQIPAETLDPQELVAFRAAMETHDSSLIESIVGSIARRCVLEETGYEAGTISILTILSKHTGKTGMVQIFCLAEGCTKVMTEGSGQEAEGITLLPLSDASEIWRMLTTYISDAPTAAHGGNNSLIAATLAFHRLGALRVEPIPEFIGTPTVVAIRGLPLSGKTTLGKALSRELGCHFIDVDVMRDAGVGRPNRDEVANPWLDEATTKREGEDMRLSYTMMHEAVRASINLGRSVILAATYSKLAAQRFLLDIVKAHPRARLRALKCVFDDTPEEVERRLQGERGRGGCLTPEHYLLDRSRYDHTDLWGLREVNTSQSLQICVAEALQFIRS